MLEALLLHLRRIRSYHKPRHGNQPTKGGHQDETQRAIAFARQHGLLKVSKLSFESLFSEELFRGSEHIVELAPHLSRAAKITIPKGFGLKPTLRSFPIIAADPSNRSATERHSIEFVDATPTEYLERWQACNEIFGDDVRLESIIQWPDHSISLIISQPQYNGKIPTHEEISTYFLKSGWTKIKNDLGHTIFYNYAYQILAIDIEPRNCYISPNNELLPFDVILSTPSKELENFLQLY